MQPILAPYLPINLLEISICFIVAIVVRRMLPQSFLKRQECLLDVLMSITFLFALFFAASESTQYLTVDDQVFAEQITNPLDRGMTQWMLGAFHSGVLLLIPIAKFANIFGIAQDTTYMLLKAFWFGLGTILFAIIAKQSSKLLNANQSPSTQIFFLIIILLLLPTDNLALKTLNYDLLSVTLSIAGVIFATKSLRFGKFPVSGVAFATLAAQEKLSASPILLLIIVIGSALTASNQVESLPSRAGSALKYAILGIGISAAVSAGSMAIFALIGPNSALPSGYWLTWTDPLTSWTWAPIRFLGGEVSFLGSRALLLVFSIVAVGLSSMAARLVRPSVKSFLANRDWTVLASLIVVLVFVLGIVGALTVRAYWAPYHPGSPELIGRYFPLNGAVIHFDASSLPQHFTRHFLYSCAIILVSIPTAVLLVYLIATTALTLGIWKGRVPAVMLLAVPFLLFMMVAATLFNVPVAHRYFNTPLLGLGIMLSAYCVTWLSNLRPSLFIILYLTVIIGTLIEVAPFRPTFASFRPIWAEYPDSIQAQPGGLNPSWMGWGEEVMLIGKELETQCARNGTLADGESCTGITLRPIYVHGQWLPARHTITIQATYPVGQESQMTNKDYYLASRLSLIQLPSIPQIAPDFVVSYRGFVQAWAWRGDRLKQANYKVGM